MLLENEVVRQIELQEAAVQVQEDAVSEAFQIEAILNRAHEIRRSRGGLFGYDLEDWLQAERELAARNWHADLQAEELPREESLHGGRERNREKCFGLHN